MNTSDNDRSLHQILDWIRMMSIIVLLLHFYFYCYAAFAGWHFVSIFSDRILLNITRTGIFTHFHTAKWIALGLLSVSSFGASGRKNETLTYSRPLKCLGAGLLLYFGSGLLFLFSLSPSATTILYMAVTMVGYILILTGVSYFSRIIRVKLSGDVFNTANESFPQEERKLSGEHILNLPTRYLLKGRERNGWININCFRHLLIGGLSGCGKTWYVVQHVIRQQIEHGFSMLIYDFKYDDLTQLAYNYYLKNIDKYPVKPQFVIINFDDLDCSQRCNPLSISTLRDIADAAESARTILLGLNMDWIDRQGDFWVESSIAFLTALIWYLRKYKGGVYCTLPHVIELMQIEYGRLFSILRAEPEIENYLSAFLSAYIENNKETLDNQVASLKIAIARLSSPTLYYIMTGNDFTLDINNPLKPKICCIGNSPQRAGVFGPAISLYFTSINRLINKEGMLNCSQIYEEFSTIYVHKIFETMAVSRSYKISVSIVIQSIKQLRLNYGKDQAEVIHSLPANIISGQDSSDGAKYLSERIGKILQDRQSIQVNRNDTSITNSKQLDFAIPVSTIAKLSAGEFVGMVADDPDSPVELKAFHGRIVQDNKALALEHARFKELPVIRKVSKETVDKNYIKVKKDIADLVQSELARMMRTPGLSDLVVVKIN